MDFIALIELGHNVPPAREPEDHVMKNATVLVSQFPMPSPTFG